MPPHIHDSQAVVFNDNNDHHDLSLFEISLASKTIEVETNYSDVVSSTYSNDGLSLSFEHPHILENNRADEEMKQEEEEEYICDEVVPSPPSQPSILERMLDCNPCTIKISNPKSALFKIRICSECGNRVHKFRNGGYKKELLRAERVVVVVDEGNGEESSSEVVETTTKVYFHSDYCVQRNRYRIAHNDNEAGGGFGLVLEELVEFVEARARKHELEEAASLLAAAAALAASARNASLGVALVKEQPRKKRPRFLLKRTTKKALKWFSSWSSCRGQKDNSTEESAFRGVEI